MMMTILALAEVALDTIGVVGARVLASARARCLLDGGRRASAGIFVDGKLALACRWSEMDIFEFNL